MTDKKTTNKKKSPMKNIFVFPMSSRRQFRRLMIVMTVLFTAVVSFHVYFFKRVESQNFFQAPPAPPVSANATVNETKLATVLQRYEDKAAVRAAALSLTPLVAEPSQ